MAARRLSIARERNAQASGDVIEELRRQYDRLTQSQKRIAQYIVENSQSVAFSTVDQIAMKLDVNPSTIVRFTYRLGLKGFPDLQERIQEMVRGKLSRATEPASDDTPTAHLADTSFGATLSHDLQNLRRTIMGLNAPDLESAVDQIVSARRVYVIAGYSSFGVAHYFSSILSRLRDDVFLFEGDNGMSAGRLGKMTVKDCLVAFTFPRYAASTYRVSMLAKERKAAIIAITDTPISAVGQIANTVLLAASAGTGMQNSLVGPVAVANALLNGVAASRGNDALDCYSQHDAVLNRTDAFLLKLDGED